MKTRSHPRGTVMVLSIIVAVIISGLVAAMAWVAGESASRTGMLSKADQAFYAAEAGAQRVEWYAKKNTLSSITSPISGSVNGSSYTTSWSTVSGTTINVTSVGSTGVTTYTMSEHVTPPAGPVPAFSSIGNFDSKNLNITGDVATAGNFSDSGAGSLTGNLLYGGTVSDTSTISGTITQGTFTSIDFSFLDTILKSSYTSMAVGGTYDFTALPGTNKVIYVNGNVTDPVIIGSGTLYVNGDITFTQPNAVVGSAGSPVNLVATGNLNFQKTTTVNGSLYTKKDWNRAQVTVTGVVYVGGISPSNNGVSSLTLSSPPWFDPRIPGGVGGAATSTIIANFSGPNP